MTRSATVYSQLLSSVRLGCDKMAINLLSDGIGLQMGSSWQSVQYRDLMYDKLVNQKLS